MDFDVRKEAQKINLLYFHFRPTLKHQRPQEEKQKQFSGITEWYKRGTDVVSVINLFKM